MARVVGMESDKYGVAWSVQLKMSDSKMNETF